MMQGRLRQFLPYIWVAIALLPILFLRDFTPANELRYLSIADEALEKHQFVCFTNHGLAYADKPPLYLWIVMLGKWVLGRHAMWFLGLFSLLPAMVIAWVMGNWSRRAMGEDYRTEGALMLFTCGLFSGMTIFLRMDMLMTMFIVLALRSFYRRWENFENTRREKWLFPVWIFLAVFTKGPMGILIPLVSTTVFLWINKEIRSWRKYWGWATWGVLLSACLLWFGGVYLEGGQQYLDNLLVRQTVGRAVDSFHHKRPFWYYFKTMPYTLAPWTFLLLGSVVVLLVKRNRPGTGLERFFLTVVVSTVVLLSFISSKIDVYLLPAYPFIVYLAVILMSNCKWNRLLALSVSLPAILVSVAAVCGVVWSTAYPVAHIAGMRGLMYVSASVLALGCGLTLWYIYREHNFRLGVRVFSMTLLLTIFTASFALPRLNEDIGYGRLAARADDMAREHGLDNVYSWKMNRPENMDVYLTRELNVVPVDKQEESGCERSDSAEMYNRMQTSGVVVMSRLDRQPPFCQGARQQRVGTKYIVTYIPPRQGKNKLSTEE